MKSTNRRTKLAATAITALFATALLAAGALAVTSPDQTRESYAAAVEPICKKNTKANEKTLAGVRKKVQQGKLGVAAGQFAKASAAFGGAVKQIKAVPQPPADVAKLAKWTKALEDEAEILGEIGKALKAEKKGQAGSLNAQLTRNSSKANNAALGFDFDYCVIDPSRFS